MKYVGETSVIDDGSTQVRASERKKTYAILWSWYENKSNRPPALISCTAQQVSLGYFSRCSPYILLDYRPVTDIVRIRRTYKKASVLLGEFGGYLKLVMTVIAIFYSIYTLRSMKNYLKEKLFSQSQWALEGEEAFLGSNKLAQKKAVKRNKAVNELMESREGVDNFLKKMNFVEILESRFKDSEDTKRISDYILQKRGSEDQKPNRFHSGVAPTPGSMFDAYNALKATNRTTSYHSKRIVNDFIIRHLKDLFESV